MFVSDTDCQKVKCYANEVPLLHHRQYSNWLDVSGKLSNSHTNLELPEPLKWLPTENSGLSYLSVLQQQPRTKSGTYHSSGGKVFHHAHGLGRQPTDRNRRQLRSQRLQLHDRPFVVVERNHSWWWPFKSTDSFWYRKTLEGLKFFTCYLEPSVCWNIFC